MGDTVSLLFLESRIPNLHDLRANFILILNGRHRRWIVIVSGVLVTPADVHVGETSAKMTPLKLH